jgi:hypothetical protein
MGISAIKVNVGFFSILIIKETIPGEFVSFVLSRKKYPVDCRGH